MRIVRVTRPPPYDRFEALVVPAAYVPGIHTLRIVRCKFCRNPSHPASTLQKRRNAINALTCSVSHASAKVFGVTVDCECFIFFQGYTRVYVTHVFPVAVWVILSAYRMLFQLHPLPRLTHQFNVQTLTPPVACGGGRLLNDAAIYVRSPLHATAMRGCDSEFI